MTVPKNRVLLFGPIGDFGGRELECGFIASVLSTRYEVTVCSTGTLTRKSQVFDFADHLTVFSIKEILLKKFFTLKTLAFFSFLKNRCKGKVSDYVNNGLAKKKFGYDKKVESAIEVVISPCDVVFIIAQLSSSLIEEVIRIAKSKNKKVLFRTTGTITFSDYEYIDSVDCFIHHSKKNAKQLEKKNRKYEIIDQCAYDENSLLEIPFVKNKVKHFLTIARLEKEKNIDIVIEAFLKVKEDKDILYVIGDGAEFQNLKNIAKNDKSIIFTGFVNHNDLKNYFLLADCIIISHYDFETGPLTGIEAMASARLILSARTGAMRERLDGIDVSWFNNTNGDLAEEMMKIKNLDANQVENLSIEIRERYTSRYSKDKIELSYTKVLDKIIKV